MEINYDGFFTSTSDEAKSYGIRYLIKPDRKILEDRKGETRMRVNIYSQELTDEVNLIEKTSETGTPYHGVQFILHSSDRLHSDPTDDDRSAVTFWLPQSIHRREQMAKAFDRAANMFRSAPAETGLN